MAGDGDHGWSEHPISNSVALLKLGDDGALGHAGPIFLGDCLVLVRVELLAQRFYGRQTLRCEQLIEFAIDGADATDS